MSLIEFNDRVAIITGAGTGLGRSHALALAKRGVKIVVNDLGGPVDGEAGSGSVGGDLSPAQIVADEINSGGGEAMAHGANVTKPAQVEAMVAAAIERWGHIDILINNAGILRDKSFAKMTIEDFKQVVDVHLMGSMICTKAVWNHMREREFGRIVMTTSSSGLYGNFGQSNYGAAKTALVGLMNTLSIEGAKNNIKVNTLAPTAATRMTENLVPEPALKLMSVESVTAALVFLANDHAPERMILCAGAGGYSVAQLYETQGMYLPVAEQTADMVAANIDKISDPAEQRVLKTGAEQTMHFLQMAMAAQQSD